MRYHEPRKPVLRPACPSGPSRITNRMTDWDLSWHRLLSAWRRPCRAGTLRMLRWG